MSGVRYVTEFGARGDGVTDDTAALQHAVDVLATGQALLLETSKTYSVTNLALPFDPNYGDQGGRKSIVGPATIKARAGGDPRYMVTDRRWLDNDVNGGSPWEFNDIQFHGNDLVDHPFINYGYARWFRDCVFEGGRVTVCLFTRLMSNGADATPFFGGNYWLSCHFRAGTATSAALFRTEGSGVNAPTDGYLIGCEFNGRDVTPYGIDLWSGSGWTIANCQGYSSAAGSSSDLRIRNTGRPSAIIGNTFEEGALFEHIGGRLARIGPGNHWRSNVTVNFTDDDTAEDIAFVGDHFGENRNADVNARLIHNSARLNKFAHALVCTAEDAAPFVESFPTTFPRMRWRSCIAKDLVGTFHDLPDNVGVNVLMPIGTGSPPEMATWMTDAPGGNVSLVRNTVAPNENLGFLNWRDTSGSIYARIGAYALVVTPGLAEGRLYFYTDDSGAQTEQFRLGDGAMVGATAAGGLKGRGTLNVEGPVYLNNISMRSGAGSPEGVVTAVVGAFYLDTTGGIPWCKVTGAGNTGWKVLVTA